MFRKLLVLSLLALALLLPGQAQSVMAQPQVLSAPQSSNVSLPVVINEVMPKPGGEGAAWVELFVGEQQQTLFLPTVFHGSSLQTQAAGIAQGQSATTATLSLAGWQVSNELGQSYTIPAQVTNVPTDTYVLIYFDGQGATGNDYNANDGKIVLHTPRGLGDIFADLQGQVALYQTGAHNPQSIVDFVTWGGYNVQTAANAAAAGIWPVGHAVSFENGFGDISEADILEPDESIGRYPGAQGNGALLWANYPAGSLSPGAANPLPPVTFVTPENGARVDTATLSLSWRSAPGASAYHFQLDDSPVFGKPLINIITPDTFFKPQTALSPGLYYWRLNPLQNGSHTSWTPPFQIEVVDLGLQAASTTTEKVLGIGRVRQNKDSYLLGLDGAPEGDPTTNTPEDAWDSPAPCTVPPCADYTKYTHGRQYCVRASIRMMASWYNGGNVLSMDRISYHILEEWSGNTRPGANDGIPDNDLGYDRGMYYPDEEDQGISWALNTTINTPGGKPSFANVKTWIDANRPIMFRNPGHMMVIDGYREVDGDQYLHILDPDQPPDLQRWQDYSTQTIDGYWVGPAGGTGRRDEASVSTDSDGDGIMNFDESVRFDLDPYNADTDGDWVPDKKDMREYVFDNAGNYSKRASDLDGDSLRKERDPDNDNDGSPDGCEDTNYNGKYESGSGETNNFSAASSQACMPIFNILYPLKLEPENAGDPAAPDKILVQVSTAVPAGWSLGLSASDFDVTIGGDAASVLSLYPSADTTFLVVDPPVKGSASYYDLEVTLAGSGSDSEANAVYYLEKAPNDEVIVLDRSGSMLSDDKIGAAQNAASAFVDFLNDGDAIGVTSFASIASTDYPLTEITVPSIRTDAINAIDGLAASGTTALGQGVQQGYGQLTAHGVPEHDWSLVLLSDGWENVAPYWVDVQASITDAVVHTVALGEGADTALLQSIAGAKHGQYFYVDVNPPTAALAASSELTLPPLGIPNTLANRLADTYVAIGELTHRFQRLAEFTDSAQEQRQINLPVLVPKGMPQAIFTLNWDTPGGDMRMTLQAPDGSAVAPDAEQRDDTHQVLVVNHPPAGLWHVHITVLKPTFEYHLMVSGKTITTLIAAVGGDPAQRTVGVPVPIYGILSDHEPIAGADVFAYVSGPDLGPDVQALSPQSRILQLFDDGHHGDGKANDGLYANLLTNTTQAGGYTVKLVATGQNNAGEPFVRYASVGFNVRPRAVYLWNEDLDTALDYQALLQANGWVVDLLELKNVPHHDFRPYALIVIGPETGYRYDFDDKQAVAVLMQWNKPFLGLGSGGAALFAEFDLYVNYGHTWWSNNYNVFPVAPGSAFWNEPLTIPINRKNPLVQLYPRAVLELGVYLPEPRKEVIPVAREERNETHYSVAVEMRGGQAFGFWGYNAGPSVMADDGKKLLVNLSHYLRR